METPAGFPHLKYTQVERERRWLCEDMPAAALASRDVFDITDHYLPQSHLRLRSAAPRYGGSNFRRLTKKVETSDPRQRLLTTIYLDETEYKIMRALGGLELVKSRHRFAYGDVTVALDCFTGPLTGLMLAEIEFGDEAAMTTFPQPAFATREVTNDPVYSGYALAVRAADFSD